MKIRHTINILIVGAGSIACSFPIMAQNDWGSSLNLGVSKKLTPKLNLSLEEEFRTRDNFGEAERFSTALDLSYKFNDYLKLGWAYNLINYNHETKGWEVRHRYYFYGTGSLHFDRFTLSLRERFQSTYRVGVKETDTRSNPKYYLRSRLELDYDIANSRWKPFVSVELYKPLNDKVDNKMDKIRYTVGTEYKINKHNALEAFYRYNNFIDDDENDGQHVIGLGYTYKF